MLENGIEIDVQNNNLFDLSVLDLCKGRGGNDPKSFIFSFKVGDEEIAFGVKQRTEIVEKIIDGHICTEIVPVPMNDHFLEIIDSKNGTLRTYSLELIEEIVPNDGGVRFHCCLPGVYEHSCPADPRAVPGDPRGPYLHGFPEG